MENYAARNALACAAGASTAMAILCRMLVHKGLLGEAEVEMLRHASLGSFDSVGNSASESERSALEASFAPLDALWHKAVLAAQTRRP